MPELTETARGYGVDVIFLTDNLTGTIEYGLWPLRHVLWLGHGDRSISGYGAERYLEDVKRENERQSDVLYIPGAETCPRFYWTGSLAGRDLVCRDHQRNLLLLGIFDAGVFEKIPEARGYLWPYDAGWILAGRALAVLFILSIPGIYVVPGFLARRSGYSVRLIRRSYMLSILLPLFLAVIIFNVAASLVPSFQIYGRDDSEYHARRSVGFAERSGLVSYWAHPEAFDHHLFSTVPIHDIPWLPLKNLSIPFTVHTDPYPSVVFQTAGYTGFGGIYEGRNTLIEPGSIWDRLLVEYIEGRRKAPAWCFGEMLYHYEGQAGKKMANVETVIWAGSKTADALMNSIRNGRFYARRKLGDASFTLRKWCASRTSGTGVEVDVEVTSSAPLNKIRVQVIRSGDLIKQQEGEAPQVLHIEDEPGADASYYRVLVFSGNTCVLASNPVFVTAASR